MMKTNPLMQTAAIVCREVAVDRAPILYAERTAPEDPADSGWQFLCGASEEDWQSAQVWAVHEVLTYEPSLQPFIEQPYGTIVKRPSKDASWVVTMRSDS